MIPSRFLEMIASSDDCTMAARRNRSSSDAGMPLSSMRERFGPAFLFRPSASADVILLPTVSRVSPVSPMALAAGVISGTKLMNSLQPGGWKKRTEQDPFQLATRD